LRPLGFKEAGLPTFFGSCDGDKIGADAPPCDNFIGDAFLAELEMTRWFNEGRIEDWVFNYDGRILLFSIRYN